MLIIIFSKVPYLVLVMKQFHILISERHINVFQKINHPDYFGLPRLTSSSSLSLSEATSGVPVNVILSSGTGN
jgi:hypothetical protein